MKLSYTLIIKFTGIIFLLIFSTCSLIEKINLSSKELFFYLSLLIILTVLLYNVLDNAIKTAYLIGKNEDSGKDIEVLSNEFLNNDKQ